MNKKLLTTAVAAVIGASSGASADVLDTPMVIGLNGYAVPAPLLTIGETFSNTTGALNSTSAGDYTPAGILDGLGAYELDEDTVRVIANHEILNFRAYPVAAFDSTGGTFTYTGSRLSYYDIDKDSREVVDAGLAINKIFGSDGVQADSTDVFRDGFGGFTRFCSSTLVEAGAFNFFPGSRPRIFDRGLEDTIYFTNEEDGGRFNSVGGGVWALDVSNGNMYQVAEFGRGAWENVTPVDTGSRRKVGFILADDTSPFDFDGDGENEAAPMYLYVGKKKRRGSFLERNGLVGGKLYVWVPDDSSKRSPLEFNTAGTLHGSWVEIDNSPDLSQASDDGSTGFDEFGYPTQGTLWLRAKDLGAFGFSRPEDLDYNPDNASEIVFTSTGVDTYAVDPVSGNGVDTFGTLYTMDTNFHTLEAAVTILYDGDADPTRALRSPDNLDWSEDGYIYVQEDEAEEDTLSGDEVLFGAAAVNPYEAGIVKVDPSDASVERIAVIDRNIVLDGGITPPTLAFDTDAGAAGEWESSGILDVSELFGEDAGSLFIFNVQAHGIEDQNTKTVTIGGQTEGPNADSRIDDFDLREGGQLLFLEKVGDEEKDGYYGWKGYNKYSWKD